ncbi:hypothetical protein BC830DRAFT_1174017 [Chytriomyces sp. MP71]|nr:hypothetical protein BC830DRAFT_1174017 [Chytriomyces sp. MP71]
MVRTYFSKALDDNIHSQNGETISTAPRALSVCHAWLTGASIVCNDIFSMSDSANTKPVYIMNQDVLLNVQDTVDCMRDEIINQKLSYRQDVEFLIREGQKKTAILLARVQSTEFKLERTQRQLELAKDVNDNLMERNRQQEKKLAQLLIASHQHAAEMNREMVSKKVGE